MKKSLFIVTVICILACVVFLVVLIFRKESNESDVIQTENLVQEEAVSMIPTNEPERTTTLTHKFWDGVEISWSPSQDVLVTWQEAKDMIFACKIEKAYTGANINTFFLFHKDGNVYHTFSNSSFGDEGIAIFENSVLHEDCGVIPLLIDPKAIELQQLQAEQNARAEAELYN